MTVLGPQADTQVAALLERHPEVAETCVLAHDRADIRSARFQGGDTALRRSAVPVRAIYVCLATETDALTAALVVRGWAETRAAPLVVAVWDSETAVPHLLRDASGRFGDFAEFAVLDETLSSDLTLLGTNELLARLRHEEYVRWERARGESEQTNASIVPWDLLPDALKESNRAFADGIGRKLAASGCVLVPTVLASVEENVTFFGEAEIEELAREEHERWMTDLLELGWQPTSGPKDAGVKRHPLLVPWDQLSEADRERDRESIRALPGMLARAGFEICRVEGYRSESEDERPL